MLVKDNLDKIANTLIYFSEKLGDTYLTKAIKLLYITDEISVHETGVPFTWLEYKVWKMGPVPEDLHNLLRFEINNNPNLHKLSEYISIRVVDNPVEPDKDSYLVCPKRSFCDDEFSEYDIDLLDRVLHDFGKFTSKELIEILHKQDTLWHKIVQMNNLDLDFKLKQNKSDFVIPFTDLIKDDELKQLAYKSAYSTFQFNSLFV